VWGYIAQAVLQLCLVLCYSLVTCATEWNVVTKEYILTCGYDYIQTK
jgi:hypothetical protein